MESIGPADHAKDPLLVGLGERVKLLRARRGMPRRVLARTANVSERHLANIESGVGNVSVLVLNQMARALDCPMAALLGDVTTSTPEWLMIRDVLAGCSQEILWTAHKMVKDLVRGATGYRRSARIALIGLRGAGKSTLGRRLGGALDLPFVELSAEVGWRAGCAPDEIEALFGPNAFRRFEREALESVLRRYPTCVIATAGGIVSDVGTFDLLLSNCFTVWLQASPEEHMDRVIKQGDLRPMADNRAAMDDLKLILAGRSAFYGKADLIFDTSGKSVDEAFGGLFEAVAGVRAKAKEGAEW